MKSVRLMIRATVVAIALLGAVASTAFADTDTQSAAPTIIPDPPTAVKAADLGTQLDPSDPLLPPD